MRDLIYYIPFVRKPPIYQYLLNELNKIRVKYKLSVVQFDEELAEVAQQHNLSMIQHNYFKHDSYERINNELEFVDYWHGRVWDHIGDKVKIGEILALGYKPENVFNAWMESPGHRKIILDPEWSHVGISMEQNQQNVRYYTIDFKLIR